MNNDDDQNLCGKLMKNKMDQDASFQVAEVL